jgi:hypothetical protein
MTRLSKDQEEDSFEVDRTLLKYKMILKYQLGYKGYQIADLMKIGRSAYYSMTRNKNRTLPKWVRAFVIIHEILERKYQKKICDCNKNQIECTKKK